MQVAARRRIWCETTTADELAAPETVALLRRWAVHPIVAVWPWTTGEARRAASAFLDAGLSPALWPMLADADGRWIGARNASRFCAFASQLSREPGGAEIVLDLEPPIASLRAFLDATSGHLVRRSRAAHGNDVPVHPNTASFDAARETIRELAGSLHAAGGRISAAIAAPVLFDAPGRGEGWQRRLGTPVDGVAWDQVTPMLYSSMLEGWSRGLLGREPARAFVAWGAGAARDRFGALAAAALGAVGTGALGDEPVYRSPAELADDVALARGAGVDDLSLFDLGGVLRRPPADAWLEAFAGPGRLAKPAPPRSLRIRGLLAGGRAAGAAFGALAHGRSV
jgi:hypothetical protein